MLKPLKLRDVLLGLAIVSGIAGVASGAQAQSPSTDASLTALAITVPDGITLAPGFGAGIFSYTASIGFGDTEVTLEATQASGATLEGHGTWGNLALGENELVVKVVAEDGTTMQNYTITVTRANPSALTALEVAPAPMFATFGPAQFDYGATAPNAVESVTVTPTYDDTNAAVFIGKGGARQATGTGVTTAAIPLAVGLNVIEVVLTQDGATATYRLEITREGALPPPAPAQEILPAVDIAQLAQSVAEVAGQSLLAGVLDVIGAQMVDLPRTGLHAPVRPVLRVVRPLVPLSAQAVSTEADWRELLGASSLRLALQGDVPNQARKKEEKKNKRQPNKWAVWMAGDVRGFAGTPANGLSDVTEGPEGTNLSYTGYLGTDWTTETLLLGIAGGYSHTIAELADGAIAEFWFLGGYPYIRAKPSEGVSVWALAGAGEGRLTIRAEHYEATLVQHLYAAGLEIDVARISNFRVAFKGDGAALFAFTTSQEDEPLGVQQQQLRAGLDFSYHFQDSLSSLRPYFEIGARLDLDTQARDFEHNIEIAAGIHHEYMPWRLTLAVQGRAVIYEQGGLYTSGTPKEWGANVVLRVMPNALDEGLSASLAPGWGTSTVGARTAGARTAQAQDWWRDSLASSSEVVRAPTVLAPSLDAEIAYGFRLRQALITPLAQYSLAARQQIFGIGTRFNFAPLSLEVLGERVDSTQVADEYRLRLESSLRF